VAHSPIVSQLEGVPVGRCPSWKSLRCSSAGAAEAPLFSSWDTTQSPVLPPGRAKQARIPLRALPLVSTPRGATP
jgi:hypothetical protein